MTQPTSQEVKHTPRQLLQECMESAVRLAFIRHSESIEFDADADTQEEIANDAACACFAEGTCTEEPIKEVAIALKRLEAFDETLSALKAAEAEHFDMATLLDAWARESVEGSWSTHQVDAMRRRADQCRRHAAAVRAAISKAGGQ